MVFVVFPLSTQHYGVRAKNGWHGIRLMCRGGATCLPMDYKYPTKRVGLVQSGHYHHLIKM